MIEHKSLGTFDFGTSEHVVTGTVVFIRNGEVVYAGPINRATDPTGCLALLNPEDYDRLAKLTKKRSN